MRFLRYANGQADGQTRRNALRQTCLLVKIRWAYKERIKFMDRLIDSGVYGDLFLATSLSVGN